MLFVLVAVAAASILIARETLPVAPARPVLPCPIAELQPVYLFATGTSSRQGTCDWEFHGATAGTLEVSVRGTCGVRSGEQLVGRHRVRFETAEPIDAREPLGAFTQTVEIQQTADEYVDVDLYLDPGGPGADAARTGLSPLALFMVVSSEVELVEQELPAPGLPAPANPDAIPRC